ncbi:TIM-barrel domain-containing protein, partial [Tessaracoccus lubricantis]
MRSTKHLLATSLLVPALIATAGLVTTPATAVEVGTQPYGSTPVTPKPATPEVPLTGTATTLGRITAVASSGNQATLTAERGKVRISFLDGETFRVEATRGEFLDPANTPQGDATQSANIIVGLSEFPGATASVTDGATVVIKAAGGVSIEVVKATGVMTAKRADGSVIWQEASPLEFRAANTAQRLVVDADEQFLGGGMQNGRSIHTGSVINVARNFDWDDHGYPNSVPFYLSSAGYGVLRNTFARGTYDFVNGTTAHEETRFDAYYFAGDYKEALDGYTKLTGRPHLPPVYALEYGDADCYNRSSSTYNGDRTPGKLTTPDAIEIAKDFVENDMPGGWMLVNDGYGCEYVDLPETVQAIEDQTGLKTGLWTQRSLTNQPYEVGEAGIRLRKLDVAWVGSGYRMALTACESANKGIEDNSEARGTALMVEGWAGAQRCGMTWTGDHSGNLDAVRWQVSALTGSGNSGQPFATGDVDGIFGGSAESYVRDLQWKAFAPALYSMSGWSHTDKRPWLYGAEATEINRSYLQLRQQLMPYIYSLSQEAHATGTPVMRHMAIEFPEDLGSYSDEANNQFMLGSDYLVAPVFTAARSRSGIYLPAGETWVDYWTGRLYPGGQVLNNHPAPLDRLPVFVRAGAVVPHGIVARNSNLTPENAELTVQVYPSGSSSYTLYEDDKVTRAYRDGARSLQTLSVAAPASGPGDVTVTIGQRQGEYAGKAAARPY